MKKGDLKFVVIFALVVLAPFAYWIYDWHHLRISGEYWPKMSLGMPFVGVSIIGLLVLDILLPGKMNDPWAKRGKNAQLWFFGVLALGFLVGTVNYFLMNRAFHAQTDAPVYTAPGQ